MQKIFITFMVYLFSLPVVADDTQSFGEIAGNLVSTEMGIREIVRAVLITTGAALIFGSFIQYRKHRKNPVEVTIGTVFMTLFAGLVLIALSFIPIQF